MTRMIEVADWKGFAARRRESKKRGKLRGIGISNYLETPVGIPHERVEVTVLGSGKVELAVGTQSTGQGHETSFAQVMADLLGVHPEDIVFIGGDTAKIPSGSGTHSDRSMRLGGTLMFQASGDVVAQAKAVAAKMLDVPEAEIDFTDGLFVTPNSNRRLTIYDVAQAMDENPALAAGKKLQSKKTFTGRIPAYPTGCAICEVEIDPDTGAISIPRYGSIDDAGQAINPLILHGQVHGGIVQGIGQALVEDVRYDESGQVLVRQLHGLRHPARASGAVVRHRAHRRSDQGQSAAGQGRRRGRHHAGAGRGDERDHGRAEGLRRRAHGHAGDAAPHLERHPGGEERPAAVA